MAAPPMHARFCLTGEQLCSTSVCPSVLLSGAGRELMLLREVALDLKQLPDSGDWSAGTRKVGLEEEHASLSIQNPAPSPPPWPSRNHVVKRLHRQQTKPLSFKPKLPDKPAWTASPSQAPHWPSSYTRASTYTLLLGPSTLDISLLPTCQQTRRTPGVPRPLLSPHGARNPHKRSKHKDLHPRAASPAPASSQSHWNHPCSFSPLLSGRAKEGGVTWSMPRSFGQCPHLY